MAVRFLPELNEKNAKRAMKPVAANTNTLVAGGRTLAPLAWAASGRGGASPPFLSSSDSRRSGPTTGWAEGKSARWSKGEASGERTLKALRREARFLS